MFGKRSSGGSLPVGAEITAHFTPAVLPGRIRGLSGLWDVADHRLALISAAPKLFAAIGQAYRLPGDIYDQATHFRYPDGTRLRRGATVTPPTPAAAYPLDAALAEIQAFNPAFGKPVMSNGDQTATLTIAGGRPSSYETIAVPTLIPPGPKTVSFSAGIKKIEWDYTMPDITGAAVNNVVCSMFLGIFYVNNFANGIVHVYIKTSAVGGVQVTELKVNRLGVDVSGFITVPRTGRIAVAMNASAGTFSVETPAGVAVLSNDTYTPATPCIMSVNFNEAINVEAAHAGKTMSATLVTDFNQMTYPPGAATDIDGGTGGGSPVWSANIGTRAGTNAASVAVTVAGHALTESEMPPHHHNLKVGDDANTPVSFGDDRAIATSLQVLPANVGTAQMYDAGGGAPHAHAASGTASIDPEHVKVLRLVRVA